MYKICRNQFEKKTREVFWDKLNVNWKWCVIYFHMTPSHGAWFLFLDGDFPCPNHSLIFFTSYRTNLTSFLLFRLKRVIKPSIDSHLYPWALRVQMRVTNCQPQNENTAYHPGELLHFITMRFYIQTCRFGTVSKFKLKSSVVAWISNSLSNEFQWYLKLMVKVVFIHEN